MAGEPEHVRAQLARILGSPAFAASVRRKALLGYLVEETLAGRADRLKGFTIATAVFDRDESFDAQADPVVRLEARRLRRDLDGYYATDGVRDRLRLQVPKGAYAVACEWRDLEASVPAEASEPGAGASEPGRPPADRRLPWLLGATLLLFVLLLAGAGTWLWQGGGESRLASIAQPRGPTVIVLPFEALSAAQDDHFLASGITTELIGDLMRFEGLRLFSVASSFHLAERGEPAAFAGVPTVSYVVRGSVASARGVVRVGATLVDARTDEVLWSETFERPLTPDDLLGLRTELAGRIASTLGQSYGVMSTDAAGRLQQPAGLSMPTYQCILRAYEYRRTFSVELHAPTVACLEEAVHRDPDYAEAWAMLAWLKLDAVRFDLVPGDEVQRVRAGAREASARAVALDPNSVRALQVLAVVEFYEGHYEASEKAQRRALELNPHDPETLAQLGWRLAARGRFEEGLPFLRRAIDRSVSPPGWYYHMVAINDFMQGDYAAALAAAEISGRNGSEVGLSIMAMSQAALGDEAAAERTLGTLETQAPEFFADPEAVYRSHQPTDGIVAALMAGLRRAGWRGPETAAFAGQEGAPIRP